MARWSAAWLFLISCAAPPETELSAGWKRFDLGPFSLSMPEDLQRVKATGIDSYVGQFASRTLTIQFDHGDYSDPLTSTYGTVIARDSVSIGGRAALIVAWRRPPGKRTAILAGVHFPRRAKDDPKLTIYAEFNEEASLETARRIFESVRFGKD